MIIQEKLDKKLLAIRIRNARTKAGLTKKDVGEMAGVSARYARYIESGERSNTETMLRMAKALKVDIPLIPDISSSKISEAEWDEYQSAITSKKLIYTDADRVKRLEKASKRLLYTLFSLCEKEDDAQRIKGYVSEIKGIVQEIIGT